MRLQKSLAQISAMYAGILAFVALMLAAAGIYGVMAFLVNQRIREIGIRMALGSTTVSLLKSVVLEGLWPTFIGIAVGVAGATALLVAGMATFIPVRRAMRVYPMVALRCE